MDLKVTVNQTNTNVNQVPESKLNLTAFKKRMVESEIYGRAIDPLTGVEFVKTRGNQKFECPESRMAYHNNISNQKRHKEKIKKIKKIKIQTLYDFFLLQAFNNSTSIHRIELTTSENICDYLKKIRL
jgi:hypothetical protein